MTFQSGKMGDIRAVTNELPEVEKAKPLNDATKLYDINPEGSTKWNDLIVKNAATAADFGDALGDSDRISKKSTLPADANRRTSSAYSIYTERLILRSSFLQAIANAIAEQGKLKPVPSSSRLPSKVQPKGLSPDLDCLFLALSGPRASHERIEFSDSEDDEDDPAYPKELRNVSDDAANMLLYKPSGKWAEFADERIEDVKIIAKLSSSSNYCMYIKQGTLGGKQITYISKSWQFSDDWEGLFSELALYSGSELLRPLQGTVVPSIIGVYIGDTDISVAMALPDSNFWIEASPDMPELLKNKVVDAFNTIHDRGIVHDDPELFRNVFIGSNGEVTVINFGKSRARTPNEEVKLKGCTPNDIELEARRIRWKLDYRDAREWEENKRRRWYTRRKHNERREKLIRRKSQGRRVGEIPSYVEAHPDDVQKSIVSSQDWQTCWTNEAKFTPTVYVVPGQDPSVVERSLKTFLDELLEAEVDAMEWRALQNEEERREELLHNAEHEAERILHCNQERSDANVQTLSGPVQGDVLTPAESPIDRISPPKPQSSKRKKFILPDGSNPVSQLYLSQGFPIDPLNPVITVPYDGYTGPGGTFSFANHYSPRQISEMRMNWITMSCIEQARIEGLPFPIAQKAKLTPATDGSAERERKRKWRAMNGLGVDKEAESRERKVKKTGALGIMRRKREEAERGEWTWDRWVEEMDRKKEKWLRWRYWQMMGERLEGYEWEEYGEFEESDDARNPRILSWGEYEKRVGKGKARHVVSEEESELSVWNHRARPRKGILKKGISEEEKFANRVLQGAMQARLEKEWADTQEEEDKEAVTVMEDKDCVRSSRQRSSYASSSTSCDDLLDRSGLDIKLSSHRAAGAEPSSWSEEEKSASRSGERVRQMSSSNASTDQEERRRSPKRRHTDCASLSTTMLDDAPWDMSWPSTAEVQVTFPTSPKAGPSLVDGTSSSPTRSRSSASTNSHTLSPGTTPSSIFTHLSSSMTRNAEACPSHSSALSTLTSHVSPCLGKRKRSVSLELEDEEDARAVERVLSC